MAKKSKYNELERLREYASMLSHNLKTPITGIKMLATFLRDSRDEKEMRSAAEDLYQATVALQEFYKEMENVYKQIHLPPNPPQKLSISNELDRVFDHLKAHIITTDAQVDVDFSGGNTVYFRSLSLNSILLNLISNAIKYAKPNVPPRISVKTVEYSKTFLQLQVSDNGIGINLDKYGDKVFGLFEKFTDHPDATGMGLYITKNQVEAMGGEIYLESVPNEGSTFFLTLPKSLN